MDDEQPSFDFDAKPTVRRNRRRWVHAGEEPISKNTEFGFMYAFYHDGLDYLKVGFTSKDDKEACWGRIESYSEAHGLPAAGWEMQLFIRTMNPWRVEELVHSELQFVRVSRGKARELFRCSPYVLMEVLKTKRIKRFLYDSSDATHGRAEKARKKREEQLQREMEEYRLEAEREREDREAKAFAEAFYQKRLAEWERENEPVRLANKKLDKIENGKFGYGILCAFTSLLAFYGRGEAKSETAVSFMIGVAVVAGTMFLVRKMQKEEQEGIVARLEARQEPRPTRDDPPF
jgi:RNA polymerase-binding transcription factor DksA